MSIKGGYKIIDLKNTAFADGVATKVAGVYEEMESNYCKPILLSGINFDAVEREDMFVKFTKSEGTYSGTLYTTFAGTSPDVLTAVVVTISNDDNVTIKNTTITSAE